MQWTRYLILWLIASLGLIWIYQTPSLKTLELQVELGSDAAGLVELFATDSEGHWLGRRDYAPLPGGDRLNTLSLNLRLAETPRAVRLDPGNRPGATIRLRKIRLHLGDHNLEFQNQGLQAWQAVAGLRELPGQGSGRRFQVTTEDPQLVFETPPGFGDWQPGWRDYLPDYRAWLLMLVLGLLLAWAAARPEVWEKQAAASPKTTLGGALLVLLLFWSLHHHALGNWFLNDDPCHLLFFSHQGLWTSFYDPPRAISMRNFTPFLGPSLGGDFQLFGLNPTPYYWHHLLAFSLALLLLYLALARFIAPLAATLVLSAWVASPAVAHAAHFLMVRHYVEGLALAAAALLAYALAVQQRRWAWAWFGAGLYLLAALNKEIFVPLVGALFFLPLADYARRLRYLLPYLAAAVIYLAWRAYMLGGHLVSGYTGTEVQEESLNLVDCWQFPAHYAQLMDWPPLHWGLLLLGLAGFAGLAIRRFPTLGLNSLAWLGGVLLPVVAVMPLITQGLEVSRYGLLLNLLLYLALVLWLWQPRWQAHPGLVPAFWLLLLAGALHGLEQDRRAWLDPLRERHRVVGEFLLHGDDARAMIYTLDAHCLAPYQELRKGEGPALINNLDCETLADYPGRTRLFRYNNGELLAQPPPSEFCPRSAMP